MVETYNHDAVFPFIDLDPETSENLNILFPDVGTLTFLIISPSNSEDIVDFLQINSLHKKRAEGFYCLDFTCKCISVIHYAHSVIKID